MKPEPKKVEPEHNHEDDYAELLDMWADIEDKYEDYLFDLASE